MVRIGVVGAGKMGLSHCAILNAHPRVELVGVCDSSALLRNALSKYSGMSTFKDYQAMLGETKPDAIVVATPTASHHEIISRALARGIHAFSEKPLCLSVEQGRGLSRAASERGLVNQVGYHNRFIAAFREARRLLAEGAIGKVYHYTAEAYGPVVLRTKGGTWRSSRTEGGGCLRDYASHVLDLVNFMLGSPDRVSGTVLKSIYSKNVEDAVFSTLWHGESLTGQLSVNWSDETFRKMTTRIEVLGTEGKIFVDRQECRIYVKPKGGFRDLPHGWTVRYTTELTEPVWYYLRGEEYSAQIDHFVSRLEGRAPGAATSFSTAVETDAVIDLLIKDANAR